MQQLLHLLRESASLQSAECQAHLTCHKFAHPRSLNDFYFVKLSVNARYASTSSQCFPQPLVGFDRSSLLH